MPYDTPGEIPQLSPKYKQSDHEVVLITDHALNPRLVTLNEGQLVAWISYSAAPSTVVFEREVARSMVCHSLVNFSIKDDELKSAPIHAGEFASFCQLKPGRYKYKVIAARGAEERRRTPRASSRARSSSGTRSRGACAVEQAPYQRRRPALWKNGARSAP